MKYFVTGASGFIGGKVAAMLAEAGHQVVALVRKPEDAATLRESGIKAVYGDIRDPESLVEPMKGSDGVFHLAGQLLLINCIIYFRQRFPEPLLETFSSQVFIGFNLLGQIFQRYQSLAEVIGQGTAFSFLHFL